jgi:hypothetical protein
MTTETNLIETLRDELRELRLARDKSDARLLLRLVEVEQEHADVIVQSGGSFDQFVQEFVRPSRYEAFKRGLASVGTDEAIELGSEYVIGAAQLTSDKKAPKYEKATRAWVAEHGAMPTRETAKRLLIQVDPREETPRVVSRQDELAKLRAENSQLRAENRSLLAKVAKLEGQQSKAKKAA